MSKTRHAVSRCDAQRFEATKVACHTSPIGPVRSWWADSGLFRLSWEEESPGKDSQFGQDATDTSAQEIAKFDRSLQAFFSGESDGLRDVRVDLRGWTAFFAEIYQACREIPAGETRCYAELAKAVGRPRAVRAVGQAMARNRIPLVIPCHRVIGSDGRLRGFSAPGGLDAKRKLLELERNKDRTVQKGWMR